MEILIDRWHETITILGTTVPLDTRLRGYDERVDYDDT